MDIELSDDLQQVMTIIETAIHDKIPNLYELLQSALDEHILPQKYLLALFKQVESQLQLSETTKLYLIALEDCYYLQLATQLCELVLTQVKVRKSGEVVFEKVLSQFCYDYFNGGALYKLYIQFELKMLKAAESEKDKKPIQSQLISIYRRVCKVPGQHLKYFIDEYNKSDDTEVEKNKLNKLAQQTLQQQESLVEFEKKFRYNLLSQNQEGLIENIAQIEEMLTSKTIEISKVFNYFDIGLFSQTKEIETMCEKYLELAKLHTSVQVQCKIYHKITKLGQPSLVYYLGYLRCLEQCKSEDTQMQQQFHRLIQKLDDANDQFTFHLEYVNIYVRNHLSAIEQCDYLVEQSVKIRQLFQQLFEVEYDQKLMAQAYIQLGKVESLIFNDKNNAKIAFEKAVQLASEEAQYWRDYITNIQATPIQTLQQRDRIRGLLKRASEVVKEDRARAIQDWQQFEQLFGTVEELEKAERKLISVLEQELQSEIEEKAAVHYPNDGIYEQFPEKTHHHHQEEVEQPKIYVDSERTVFVNNLPKDWEANRIIELLGQDSGILECRVVKDKQQQSKGFAYMDFNSSEQAGQAAKYLCNKVVMGQQIYAAQSKPPKLYTNDSMTIFVDNLPYSITEEGLREKCRTEGIKEVRIVQDEKGRPKGYAYIEFEDNTQLQRALQLLTEDPYIDGRKVFAKQSDSLDKIKRKQENLAVIIKNIPFKMKESDIKQLFDGMKITQINIPIGKDNRPRGFAFVQFDKYKEFKTALDMSGVEVKGRKLEILKSDRRVTQESHRDQKEQRENKQEEQQEVIVQPKKNSDFKKLFA